VMRDDCMPTMTFGFIIDDPETLTVDMDTTLLMVSECNARGIRVLMTTPERLFMQDGKLYADWWLSTFRKGDDVVSTLTEQGKNQVDDSCHILFMRKDPPLDWSYHSVTQLLLYTKVKIVNNPVSLLAQNEKLIPSVSPFAIPESYVSRNIDFLMEIIESSDDDWVVKQMDDKGGNGVFRVSRWHYNNRLLLQQVTSHGTAHAVLQRYIEEVERGDKRIFMLGGRPLGWMNRIPPENDFRANIHLGASPEICTLTDRDKEICEWINTRISPMDVPMIAIDVIGGFLSEVNITSPSGIPEINRITNESHERAIIDYFLGLARGA
jgi:glutathione synthase